MHTQPEYLVTEVSFTALNTNPLDLSRQFGALGSLAASRNLSLDCLIRNRVYGAVGVDEPRWHG